MPLTLVHAGKYMTKDKLKIQTIHKLNTSRHTKHTRHRQRLSETVKTFPNLAVTQAKHPADSRHRQRLSERVKTFPNLTVPQTKHPADTRHRQRQSRPSQASGPHRPSLGPATFSKLLRKIERRLILGQSLTISGKTLTR